MHVVVGRRTSEVDAAWLRARAAEHERTILDLGTGDGRAVIVEATADPRALVIGIDADARTMAERSRRAAAASAKGGHPNAVFLASGVELLPPELDGIADRVTVRFPWGSLLRGAIGADPAVSASIARLVSPVGTLELAVSMTSRHDPSSLHTGSENTMSSGPALKSRNIRRPKRRKTCRPFWRA